MTRRMCWGYPVIYSCVREEFIGGNRTRFACDPRLTNKYVTGAGIVAGGNFTPAGLAARPFPFRVGVHSDAGLGPTLTGTGASFWNSCQGKDGCGDGGEHARCMTEEQMILWLLEDEK